MVRPTHIETCLPQPWCKNRMRSNAKALGITEMLLSFFGLILTLIFSLAVLNLREEIMFIQAHASLESQTDLQQQVLEKDKFYTLNADFKSPYRCNLIAETFVEFFETFIRKSKYTNLTAPRVDILRSERNKNVFSCELRVQSRQYPYKLVQDAGDQNLTIAMVLALAISVNNNGSAGQIESNFKLVNPNIGRVKQRATHPSKYGHDPAKAWCIEDIMRANTTSPDYVQERFDYMIKLFTASSSLSVLIGILLTTTGFDPSPIMLLGIFVLEWCSIGIMSPALITLNQPMLCLLQYAGVSPAGVSSPKYVQTIVTYISATYIVVFKGFSLYYILAFAEVARQLPPFPRTISKSSMNADEKADKIASVAEKIREKNQRKPEKEFELNDLFSNVGQSSTSALSAASTATTINQVFPSSPVSTTTSIPSTQVSSVSSSVQPKKKGKGPGSRDPDGGMAARLFDRNNNRETTDLETIPSTTQSIAPVSTTTSIPSTQVSSASSYVQPKKKGKGPGSRDRDREMAARLFNRNDIRETTDLETNPSTTQTEIDLEDVFDSLRQTKKKRKGKK